MQPAINRQEFNLVLQLKEITQTLVTFNTYAKTVYY